MRTLLALALGVLGVAQEPLQPVRSFTGVQANPPEKGLHDASLAGRVVDPEGRPVPNARVALLPDIGPSFVLAEDRTDADGRFHIDGVDSPYGLLCSILPPDHLRPADYYATAISHRLTDLGDLAVGVNTRLSGTVEIRDADGVLVEYETAKVSLRPLENPPGVYLQSTASTTVDDDGGFVLEHFEIESAELQVHLPGRPWTTYSGALELTRGELGRRVLVTCSTATVEKGQYSLIGRCEVIDLGTVYETPRPRVTRGRVSLSDGTPIPHALVTCFGGLGRSTAVEADAEGWFELESPAPRMGIETPGAIAVFYTQESAVPNDQRDTARVVPTTPWMDVVLEPSAFHEPILDGGVDRDEVVFEWWNGRAWHPIPEALLGKVLGNSEQARVPLKARGPDRLPALAFFGPRSKELRFDFTSFEPHRLEVGSPSGPVEGADVWFDAPGVTSLARARTGADGVVALAGAADVNYTVHVSARGFAARDLRFAAGTTKVKLEPLSGELRVKGLDAREELCIARAGESMVLLRLRPASGPVRLPSGEYDALVVEDGGLRRGRAFRIDGAPLELDVSIDELPRVVLTFPPLPRLVEPEEMRPPDAGKWWANATRAIPPTGGSGAWVSTTSGASPGNEVFASLVESSERRIELRVPGRGAYVLSCGAPVSLDYWMIRRVELEPREILELEVPPATARSTGLLDRYHGNGGFHGIAGPRLFLDGEGPTGPGWSLVVAMPEREADDRFELRPIPAGTYHVMHHLVAGEPIYGGTEVTVPAGGTAALASFGESEVGAVWVRVVDGNGAPVAGQVVIADPMSEAWNEFQKIPTTARFASDPIPFPMPVVLADGEAEFSGVQAGLLLLEVRRADGRAYAYRTMTAPGETVLVLAP